VGTSLCGIAPRHVFGASTRRAILSKCHSRYGATLGVGNVNPYPSSLFFPHVTYKLPPDFSTTTVWKASLSIPFFTVKLTLGSIDAAHVRRLGLGVWPFQVVLNARRVMPGVRRGMGRAQWWRTY